MIEAHVQYTGGGWQVFKTLQPGLKCEFSDHRSCKAVSVRLQEEEDAKTEAVKAAEAVERKKDIDAAAVKAKDDHAKAETDAAGQKKFEAVRVVNLEAAKQIEVIGDKLADLLGMIQSKAIADCQEAEKKADAELEAVNAERKAKLDGIEAQDWLSIVRSGK